ncbi:MAG TPA: hypothetical protein QGF58_13320 [Myxococcota bacterium]|nr:hypothetical protein [Myxococcota bacterium]
MQRWKDFVERWWVLSERTAKLQRVLAVVLPPVLLGGWMWGIHRTGRWPSGDGPHVLGVAMRLAQQLRELDLGTFAFCLDSLLAPHPPGAYLPATLAYTILGTSLPWAHLAAAALVLWLIWDGMRRLGGGPLSAVWLAAAGGVWQQAEIYGVDFIAAACVVQSLSHLVASKRLHRRLHVVGWAAWMAAAFLTKYSAPFFLALPCLVAGVHVIREKRWKELGVAIGVFAIIALPWWGPHFGAVLGYVGADDTNNSMVQNKLVLTEWNLDRFSWYSAVIADNLGWLGVIAAAGALFAWPRRRDLPVDAWLIPMIAVVSGYLILCAQTQRQARYLLPMIPLVAAAAGSSRFRWALALPAAIGAYGSAALFFQVADAPKTRAFEHSLATAGESWPWPPEALRPMSLDPSSWQLDEALGRVRELHGSDEGTVGFMLSEEHGGPGVGLVLYRAGALGYRWHVSTPNMRGGEGSPSFYVLPFTTGDWPDRDCDVVLAMTRPGDVQSEQWLTRYGLNEVEVWPVGYLSASLWQRARPRPSEAQ